VKEIEVEEEEEEAEEDVADSTGQAATILWEGF
jgi:hypothetical protein